MATWQFPLAIAVLGCERRDVGHLRQGALVGRLLAFAEDRDLVLRSSDGETIEPTVARVAAAARASDAARFVVDPDGVLAALHSATRT
jgi:hypothetical protein